MEEPTKCSIDQSVRSRKYRKICRRSTNKRSVNTVNLTTTAFTSSSAREDCAGTGNVFKFTPKHSQETCQAAKREDDTQANKKLDDVEVRKKVKQLRCGSVAQQLAALKILNRILISGDQSLIEIFIEDTEVVEKCIHLMKMVVSKEDEPESKNQYKSRKEVEKQLRLESARIVLHVAATGHAEQVRAVVDEGAVEAFIDLLRYKNHSLITDIAVSALGHILIELPADRNSVINKGIIPPLVDLVTPAASVAFLGKIALVIGKLCHPRKPSPPEDMIRLCLPALTMLIRMTNEEDILVRACTALNHLCGTSNGTENQKKMFKEMTKSGLVKRLVELLDSGNEDVITACLPIVTNLVTSSDLRAELITKAKVLPRLKKLLKSKNGDIVEDAANAVRILSAHEYLEVIRAGFVPLLVNVLNTKKLDTRDHAIRALVGIALRDEDHLTHLCGTKAVAALCSQLRCDDANTVLLVLQTILKVLECATKLDKLQNVTSAFKKCRGLDVIKKLNKMKNRDICKLAIYIPRIYFPE